NLFNYITFRAAGATVTALLLAFIVGPWIIRKLQEHKVGQVIRAEGPASHHGKRGTPTMGGLIIILATVVPTLLWARLDSRYVVVAVVAMLWAGAIGFLDDYLKIVRGKSQGLVARWKLVTKPRSEEHTSELQSRSDLVCRLLLEKKKENNSTRNARAQRPPQSHSTLPPTTPGPTLRA